MALALAVFAVSWTLSMTARPTGATAGSTAAAVTAATGYAERAALCGNATSGGGGAANDAPTAGCSTLPPGPSAADVVVDDA